MDLVSNELRTSRITTRENLSTYERDLFFDRNLLRGQTVLNFGSGGSNLKRDLEQSGIKDTRLIDVDLMHDPGRQGNIVSFMLRSVEKLFSDSSRLHKHLVNIRRRHDGIEGRNFIQVDGRHLPFKDGAFDTTLARLSTYQVPDDAKEQVFRELLRVSNILHIATVNRDEQVILNKLANKMGFEILFSLKYPQLFDGESFNFLNIKNQEDYDFYRDKYPVDVRVVEPESKPEKYGYQLVNGIPAMVVPGNVVIMRRLQQGRK